MDYGPQPVHNDSETAYDGMPMLAIAMSALADESIYIWLSSSKQQSLHYYFIFSICDYQYDIN